MKQKPRNLSANAPGRPRCAVPPPSHSDDGVDLTLIRWMLSLTPAERLAVLQANARAIVRLRNEPFEQVAKTAMHAPPATEQRICSVGLYA